MQSTREMQQGWDFAVGVLGADVATRMGDDYTTVVEQAIRQLEDSVNNHQYRNLGIKQLQGYMLEEWGAGTFNVKAAASGSSDRPSVLHSTLRDSVDIKLDSGSTYSAKSYATAEQTAKAQARFNPDTRQASYHGQSRLIPSDQLDDARLAMHRENLSHAPMREDVSHAYAETERKLTDRVSNSEGIESKTATRTKIEQIAKESKAQNFKAKEHGVTASSTIKTEYLLKQAVKTGYMAAAITVAIQLTPKFTKQSTF